MPATDVLLVVGEGLVGCATEGYVVQADEGHVRHVESMGRDRNAFLVDES